MTRHIGFILLLTAVISGCKTDGDIFTEEGDYLLVNSGSFHWRQELYDGLQLDFSELKESYCLTAINDETPELQEVDLDISYIEEDDLLRVTGASGVYSLPIDVDIDALPLTQADDCEYELPATDLIVSSTLNPDMARFQKYVVIEHTFNQELIIKSSDQRIIRLTPTGHYEGGFGIQDFVWGIYQKMD